MSRWTKTVVLSAGVYRFSGAHDDGIRAYIDGVPVVDQVGLRQRCLQRSPDSAVPVERFSARWRRTKAYAKGTYRFSWTGDDGIRVLVDGSEVIDGWFYQPPTTYTEDGPLSEAQHTVAVEYFEHTGGAVVKFSESKVADLRSNANRGARTRSGSGRAQ